MRCPLYRTLHKAIQLTSSYELVDFVHSHRGAYVTGIVVVP